MRFFRFAATHGWAPNRISRTESFLQKLKRGEKITVNTGIIQNRSFVGDLAGMIVDVALKRGQGVFHLGPITYSFEHDFLRELSLLFGYSSDLIIEGEHTPTNAYMVPEKIFELIGQKWKKLESDTLSVVTKCKELQKYRADGHYIT